MADFAAILQKTLDRMGETTPEVRAKVYDKARQTVQRQIAAMDEPPPQETIDRQMARLDEAIEATEARYAEAEAEDDDGFYDDDPAPAEAEVAPAIDPMLTAAPAVGAAGAAPLYVDPPVATDIPAPGIGTTGDTPPPANDQGEARDEGGSPRWLWPAVGLIALLAIGGAGYFAYTMQANGPQTAALTGEDAEPVDVRDVDPEPVTETVDAGGNGDDVEKFTQRLTEDGREIDEGPAEGAADAGEGNSVAGQTALLDQDDGAAADDGQTVVPVGQRTIFYEERTGTQPGTAMQGATIWSVSQESPGADLPLEPAINARASIPDLGLNMEMTIRRNGDATFPASHIVELFFTVPDTFEGRGIADVQRITFKDTEQDTGSALIAVPAPLDTNIFLIALTDAQTAVDTNISLMRSQGWIDIPMQYITGRRALITLEKGVAGDRVFGEVFDAWAANPLPSAAAPVPAASDG